MTICLCIPGHGAEEDFIDFMEELRHSEIDQRVKFTKALARHAKI